MWKIGSIGLTTGGTDGCPCEAGGEKINRQFRQRWLIHTVQKLQHDCTEGSDTIPKLK